jgi:hypothetical protein
MGAGGRRTMRLLERMGEIRDEEYEREMNNWVNQPRAGEKGLKTKHRAVT